MQHVAPKDIVFNYSDMELTEDMRSLLNLGLNYSILPLKLDITQVLADFRKFERSAIWQEYWNGHENDPDYKPPIFKSQKIISPKITPPPRVLNHSLVLLNLKSLTQGTETVPKVTLLWLKS